MTPAPDPLHIVRQAGAMQLQQLVQWVRANAR
jgi:hypothetical protein